MTEARIPRDYQGQRIALLTQHGKERVIAPRFAEALGARVERVDGYDTDDLGTFTREISRPGTQIEAARRKARIGMTLAGASRGLASEGSFGADPVAGLFPWNVELVIFIDDVRGIEIVGQSQAPAVHRHALVGTHEELGAFTTLAEFPSHALVIRPDSADDPCIRKGITDWPRLQAAFEWARSASVTGRVFIESDLRAYANPTRMKNIAAATDDLVRRIRSECPACGSPGFWITERIGGLPCADCGYPTRETAAERYGCPSCRHEEIRRCESEIEADPARCEVCNP